MYQCNHCETKCGIMYNIKELKLWVCGRCWDYYLKHNTMSKLAKAKKGVKTGLKVKKPVKK